MSLSIACRVRGIFFRSVGLGLFAAIVACRRPPSSSSDPQSGSVHSAASLQTLQLSGSVQSATVQSPQQAVQDDGSATSSIDAATTSISQHRGPLTRFESRQALNSYLHEALDNLRERAQPRLSVVAPSVAPAARAATADGGSRGAAASITNTQVLGVDEGDIVKVHGHHLVVLRRGRLFSIDLSNGNRRAVSRVDLVAPGSLLRGQHQESIWYDELLLYRNLIVVVGYNYPNNSTELVFFDINARGVIRPRGRFYLRSNDYYSSRNYASRLVGSTLVIYMPYSLITERRTNGGTHFDMSLPAIRPSSDNNWSEIVTATEIYRPIQRVDHPILHTVVRCDLEQWPLRCRAQGIIGPYARTFYVSQDAVFLWVHGGFTPSSPASPSQPLPSAAVYRLPLDQGEVSAVRVAGAPIDQFSFQQQGTYLNVLVRAEGTGDWMWSPEVTAGDFALVRIPLGWFDEGLYTAPATAYTRLPRVEGWSIQNRFVGDHLLYGSGGGWRRPAQGAERRVIVHSIPQGHTTSLPLSHVVDRIEPMGRAAVVIGSDGQDLVFTSVSFDGEGPRVVDRFVQQGVTQGETRSHGFFYKPTSDTEGMFGLPIRRGDSPGWYHLVHGSAEVVFVRVRQEHFFPLGALVSRSRKANDNCIVSCFDWYGNARPIFYQNRIFALLGYELVEGQITDSRMQERGRINFLR